MDKEFRTKHRELVINLYHPISLIQPHCLRVQSFSSKTPLIMSMTQRNALLIFVLYFQCVYGIL